MVDIHNPSSTMGAYWVKTWRKVYHPLGFKKGYNFPLFVILVGALMGFTLSRFMYLDFVGPRSLFIRRTIPSDAVHYLGGSRQIGIMLHLVGILFSAFFVCFQFVPVIRYKALLFHRINGYLVIILFLISTAGAYMIIPSSAGGVPATQVTLGILATLTFLSLGFAYYNIKILRIDRHREWMIRTWVYAASIISMRLIMKAADHYLKTHPAAAWSVAMPCTSIWQQYALYGVPAAHNPTTLKYPACVGAPASNVSVAVSVHAAGPEGVSATNVVTFPLGLILALFLHAAGVELYFRLTPAEALRLRNVSRERRVEAGFESVRDKTPVLGLDVGFKSIS